MREFLGVLRDGGNYGVIRAKDESHALRLARRRTCRWWKANVIGIVSMEDEYRRREEIFGPSVRESPTNREVREKNLPVPTFTDEQRTQIRRQLESHRKTTLEVCLRL